MRKFFCKQFEDNTKKPDFDTISDPREVTVDFDKAGTKKMFSSFAKLKKI